MIIGLIKEKEPYAVNNFTFKQEDGWYEATGFKDIDGKMIYDGHRIMFETGTVFQVYSYKKWHWRLAKIVDGVFSDTDTIPLSPALLKGMTGKIHSHIHNSKS